MSSISAAEDSAASIPSSDMNDESANKRISSLRNRSVRILKAQPGSIDIIIFKGYATINNPAT
jgi:hypothetical protein